MSIEILTICEWSAASNNCSNIQHPTWDEVESAIRDLNEGTHNDLYLRPIAANMETYLAVGGGNGRYLVTGSVDNERFPTVVRAVEDAEARDSLVVGGQAGDYPRHWILDLETALRAAHAFYETGEFAAGDVTWQDV